MERSLESSFETVIYMNEIVERLRVFMANEARSCSMDCGCVTPLYVYRMWGGTVSLEDIKIAIKKVGNLW